MTNKVEFTESKEGLHFKLDCEDAAVLERLTHLLTPFTESSNEPIHYVDLQASTGDYLPVTICDKIFLWPKWLKANYLAMSNRSQWSGHMIIPQPVNGYWSSPGQVLPMNDKILDLNLPDIYPELWDLTLTKNPWNGQETS